MTDERKAELIAAFENALKPANLTVYNQPDPNVEGSDGFVTFYDYIGVSFGKNAEEQAVINEQLAKMIGVKCKRPVEIVKQTDGNGHCTVWFKHLPQPEAPAPSVDEPTVSPPEPPTPAKEESAMSVCEEEQIKSYARHHRSMLNNFIAAAVLGVVMAIFMIMTDFMPEWTFIPLMIGVGILALYAIGAIFEAGYQSAAKYYEPKLLAKRYENQELWKKSFDLLCSICTKKRGKQAK